MAKFNIEVELDWLHDEEDIDESIKEEVISGIQARLTNRVEKDVAEEMSERVTEEVGKVVDAYLEKVTLQSLDKMTFPYKTDRRSSEVKYINLTEYIGKKYEETLSEKTLDERGRKTDYRRDAEYSVVEYLTRGIIAKELNEKVVDMIQQAKTQAEQTLVNNLEENLQLQLNADMLQRLNVPALLKQLQNTIAVDGDQE